MVLSYIGIKDINGILQFETLEHQTLFNKDQIKLFLDDFSEKFNFAVIVRTG